MQEILKTIIQSWVIIISVGAGIAVILGFLHDFYRRVNSAKFMIFILPDKRFGPFNSDEVVISQLYEVRLKPDRCVPSIKSEGKMQKGKILKKAKKIFVEDDKVSIPFIIQNIGRKESDVVELVIRFNTSQIHIYDFHAEYFSIEAFYSQNNKNLKSKILKERNPEVLIRKYYEYLGLTADWLLTENKFSGGDFEMVVLDVTVPSELNSFAVIFKLECPNVYAKQQIMVQWFECIRNTSYNIRACRKTL